LNRGALTLACALLVSCGTPTMTLSLEDECQVASVCQEAPVYEFLLVRHADDSERTCYERLAEAEGAGGTVSFEQIDHESGDVIDVGVRVYCIDDPGCLVCYAWERLHLREQTLVVTLQPAGDTCGVRPEGQHPLDFVDRFCPGYP